MFFVLGCSNRALVVNTQALSFRSVESMLLWLIHKLSRLENVPSMLLWLIHKLSRLESAPSCTCGEHTSFLM